MNLKCLKDFAWDFGRSGGIRNYTKDRPVNVDDINGALMVKYDYCAEIILSKGIQVEENKAIQSTDENKKTVKKLKLKLKGRGKNDK